MIQRSERVLSSLSRIKDFVVAQHRAAVEQQQRSREEAPTAHQPEYGENGSNSSEKDSRIGNGFAGGDAKKRRGVSSGGTHVCLRY